MPTKLASDVQIGDTLLVPAREIHEDLAGLGPAQITVEEVRPRGDQLYFRDTTTASDVRYRSDEPVEVAR
jgi:hypothetical protein